jgi:hypothetical protein
MRKVHLPSGIVIEVNGSTVEEIRQVLTAAGAANLIGAPAVEQQDGSVRFSEPVGGGKA